GRIGRRGCRRFGLLLDAVVFLLDSVVVGGGIVVRLPELYSDFALRSPNQELADQIVAGFRRSLSVISGKNCVILLLGRLVASELALNAAEIIGAAAQQVSLGVFKFVLIEL